MEDDNSTRRSPDAGRRGMIRPDELSFGPKIRWKIWIPVLVLITSMVGVYFVVEARRGRRQRAQLLAEHAVLTERLGPAYRRVREQIERLTFAAVGPWQGTYRAPGFDMQDLAAHPVLYGRVRMGEIHRPEDVATSIRHRYPDEIASCLGVETRMVPHYYARGDFLMPSYVDSVRNISNGQRLAYLRQDLEFRLRRDTADLVDWSRQPYFVLAMDEAALSIDGPTRVYIWDLRNGQLVFRGRSEGNDTVLVPIHISGVSTGQPSRAAPRPMTLAQHDCAVANEVRQQLGVPIPTLRNTSDGADAGAVDAGADAAAAADESDAAIGADGH